MKIIDQSIRYPTTTAVGVIMLLMFGAIALARIPVQLTPSVEDPVISIITIWPGASPAEVEREIVDEQERQLKSVEGLVEMESQCSDSAGTITLTFRVGTDLDSAMLRVSNRLEQVPNYPADAEKPLIQTVDPNANAIAWFVLLPTEDNPYPGDVWALQDFIDDFIKPEFERVPDVAVSNFFGGRAREMHVVVDPAQLAQRRVTVNEVAAALERENRNFSGGDFSEGKRRYIVRTVGEYGSPEDIEEVVVAVRNEIPIYLKDVGKAELGYAKPGAHVFNKGREIIAINVTNVPGSNVLRVMEGVNEARDRLNAERLAPMGLQLILVYDQTDYINSAVDLVQQSLIIGGFLAIAALLLYLRSVTSTLVIAVAIPISVVGGFLAMSVFGRSLNVVSLAGMAFAVGMVVDNAIVVLENIYRHRQSGKRRIEAAYDGAREVWGAVLASTLTTIAVFVPVVFMKEEVGQLFGDIALAISCAVGLSLIVSITVIPALSAKILGRREQVEADAAGRPGLFGLVSFAGRFTDAVGNFVYRLTGSLSLRLGVVLLLTLIAVGGSWLLMPKKEYLPLGNQNWIIGFLLPPPGYSLDEVNKLQEIITEETQHLWQYEAGSDEAIAQPGGGIDNFFFVTVTGFSFLGAKSNDPLRVRELIPEFMRANARLPGSIFVMNQSSLFERGLNQGRAIDIEITGPDLNQLIALGGEIFGRVQQLLPDAQARPIPSLDLGNPEVQVKIHRQRAAELGISNRELGYAVSALVDGTKASDYQFEGKEIDLRLIVAGRDATRRTHLLEELPIATPQGDLVTLGSIADVTQVNGPVQIHRTERQRAITVQVTPSEEMALEQAMETIENEIVAPLRSSGRLSGLYQVALSGSADKLDQAVVTIRWNLLLALAITFLLLAALFESFIYPLVIMVSVPLASLGGLMGLRVVDLFSSQALDVLTMMGFIILIGTVVNNPILIVHQSLNHMRHQAMGPREAIREAVRNRMRPIFMSVTTSVMGMLPLVLFPGAGAELYRGLGGVVIGGLLVSTVFTLLMVPALFSLVLDLRSAIARRFSQPTPFFGRF